MLVVVVDIFVGIVVVDTAGGVVVEVVGTVVVEVACGGMSGVSFF